MGLGVGAAGRTGGVLWLAVTPCFLGLLLVEAQTTTSGSEDAGVLLEARAAADKSACTGGPYTGGSSAPCPLDSWTAATEPCGDGHDDSESGWVGVICDARGGRVVYVYLWHTGVGGELLPFFGRLGALLILVLQYNPALRGDVADLAGATELRHLNLWDCPLVVGEAAALAALVHLGEEYTIGEDTSTGRLYLAGSGVHGPVAALRALPGLGAHWGMEDSSDPDLDGFSKCSAFAGCGAAGLAPVDGAAGVAGVDECACCADSPLAREEGTGLCECRSPMVRLDIGFCGTDCAGTWSSPCSSDCVWATWTETVAQSGHGAACPSAPSCPAGEGDCPPDIDCEGSWSDCSSDCVLSTWTETVAQSGQGAACPPAPSCPAGEGDCPPDMWTLLTRLFWAPAPAPAPDLLEFLSTLNMEEHLDAMAAQGVSSLEDLKLVTEERQLTELGVSKAMHRIKLLKAIKEEL